MKEFFLKKKNIDIIVGLEALAVFAMAVLAIHDTNTATGAGYLLFIRTGSLSREAWNLIVDIVLVTLAVILLFVPAKLLKADIGSASVFFLSVSAFSVYLRPDRFIAPFTQGDVMPAYEIKNSVISWIPVWIVCAAVLALVFFTVDAKKRKLPLITAAVSALCLPVGALTPAFEIFIFASGYFLTIPFLNIRPDDKGVSPLVMRLIPGTVLFLRSIWRLFMVLSTYHM